jgi:hypothetical protein
MRHLISKLIAAAISAAVVLLWWPIIMSTDGPESWALRAVAWTLLFECVLALLAPIEDGLWESFDSARRVAAKVANTKHKVYAEEHAGPKQMASRAAVVALVAAVPLGLIVGGPAPAKPKSTIVKRQGTTKVIRITKVIRVDQYGNRIAPTETTTAPVEFKNQSKEKKSPRKRATTKHVAATPKKTPAEPTEPVATPELEPAPQDSSDPASG